MIFIRGFILLSPVCVPVCVCFHLSFFSFSCVYIYIRVCASFCWFRFEFVWMCVCKCCVYVCKCVSVDLLVGIPLPCNSYRGGMLKLPLPCSPSSLELHTLLTPHRPQTSLAFKSISFGSMNRVTNSNF